ncbi:sensor histidine kinase [Eisenbergiella porci]|uniref:sensor histidine kinase n=1 Tax=Eisenbergiella porci TaxID=2652274 RepID=UPI002A82F565|nr:HAMP domain-containing sensor histidine kinase [Eisenbergiella porci]
MKQVERFFRRYIFSIVGILLAFFAVNLILLLVLFSAALLNEKTMGNFPISTFSEHISMQNGELTADSEAMELLQREAAWAMILNDAGTVIWEKNLPEELPRTFTVPETALFSKWYLHDYPVTIWIREEGLLVVGFRPGAVFKYNISASTDYIRLVLAGAVAAFSINLLLMLYLFIRNTRRIERAMRPILAGIQALSQGKSCKLEEGGELAEINAGINKAGAYLIKKDNTRAEWIRGISHDIRTPLSMILGYASEIEDTSDLPENIRKQAGVICRQSEKLENIVTDLNLTTKLEYSMQPIQKQSLDPVELVRQVVSEIINTGLSEQYDINVSEERSGGKAIISVDKPLLQRMLGNLIQNCIVHNPAGCKIIVSVCIRDTECSFMVTDSGHGISEAYLKRLNNDENVSSTQKQTGEVEHGLGLKIVRQIVRAHQGVILFSEVHPHGLSVEIKLPIADKNFNPKGKRN